MQLFIILFKYNFKNYNNYFFQLVNLIKMLIPQFKLEQDDENLIIEIRLPYIKIKTAEFFIE